MTAIEKMQEVAARASLKSRSAQREAAAKTEKGETTQSKFEQDFNLVDAYFGLDKNGEREQALEAAKNDPANARICYAAIANSLRKDASVGDITGRIQARIAAERKETA